MTLTLLNTIGALLVQFAYQSYNARFAVAFYNIGTMFFAVCLYAWIKDYVEHYVEMVNECVNKHCFTLGKHKKLLWILTAMCGALQQQFHPWIKPMKRVPNKSLKKLQQIYPTWKESDLETLDKVITDRELEELIEAHGIDD